MNWIKCSERTPDGDDLVIAFGTQNFENGNPIHNTIGIVNFERLDYSTNINQGFYSTWMSNIVMWMPAHNPALP